MKDIRIFMCCHKGYSVIPPLCEPIHCGAALSGDDFGALRDDAGDNISEKNREYCELTAHYYAWKNVRADYYGFCHYRRFFCAEENARLPYLVRGALKDAALLGGEAYWRDVIARHDIIAPRSEDMGMPAREHYCTSRHHFAQDLELFVGLLAHRAPQLSDAAQRYLAQDRQYFCNMFIMDRERFFEYCGILFGTLEEFDRRKTLHGDFQADRTDGYLGEIFTGIYITYCRENGASVKELPRLDIGCTAGKRLAYRLFPPESGRRFAAKRLAKKLRG